MWLEDFGKKPENSVSCFRSNLIQKHIHQTLKVFFLLLFLMVQLNPQSGKMYVDVDLFCLVWRKWFCYHCLSLRSQTITYSKYYSLFADLPPLWLIFGFVRHRNISLKDWSFIPVCLFIVLILRKEVSCHFFHSKICLSHCFLKPNIQSSMKLETQAWCGNWKPAVHIQYERTSRHLVSSN